MRLSHRRVTKGVALVVVLATLAACGLPRSGPNKREIFKSATDENVQAFVVSVDERITRAIPQPPDTSFPAQFTGAAPLAPSVIRPGDTLNFTVYENIDDGLFSRGGSNASIGAIQVDDTGFIFIPYAGRIRAAGNTPERLRQIITDRLIDKTPQPQVVVQRSAGDGGTVSLVGNGIGGQGTYPIGRSNLRLMGMLADAGGGARGGAGADVGALEQGHVPAVLGQLAGGECPGDASADDDCRAVAHVPSESRLVSRPHR